MTAKNSMLREESDARWWESYLVRYAIGTIIGALCAYALLNAIGGNVMSKALMMPPVSEQQIDVLANACKEVNANACVAQLQIYQDLYGFNLPQLLLLGIYGLAYCYLASAPGLVVHAIRRQLMSEDQCAWYVKYAVILFAAVLLIPFAAWMTNGNTAVASAVLFSATMLMVWQLFALKNEYRQKDEVLSFNECLHRARRYPKISLDSYRHLREHGNAFFIVVLELMFLAVALSVYELFGANPYWPALLVFWIVPGAAVYFLGHRIESLMVEKHGRLPGRNYL